MTNAFFFAEILIPTLDHLQKSASRANGIPKQKGTVARCFVSTVTTAVKHLATNGIDQQNPTFRGIGRDRVRTVYRSLRLKPENQGKRIFQRVFYQSPFFCAVKKERGAIVLDR